MATIEQQLTYLERKVDILNRLAEISAVLNSTLELDLLLGYLMDAAAEVTGSEGASVLLWDDNARELRFAATNTGQADLNLIGKSVPLEGSLAGAVLRGNHIVEVDNTASDARHYSQMDASTQFETRSLLGVPMTIKDRVIGVLEAVNKRQLPWTADDRDYLSVLAAQAAVAIEGAKMVSALQKANKELSELDKLKNDFIAIASHELRTPLAVILGYASFLQAESHGTASEHAARVMASGLQLRRIIEDLMNLRYLQQNAMELSLERVPLLHIIEDAAQEVLSLAEAKKQKITIAPVSEDIIIHVDRLRAAMALTNLLNNAVRFTDDSGSISIGVENRAPKEVWVTVTDTGIGLTEEHAGRIFDKFYQVEDHMTRVHGGLGIGLSIARALLEAHGGRIWASSPGLGKGSTFTMVFPLPGEK